MPSRSNRKVWLLLTATVDPKGMSFTRRSASSVRLKDYGRALNRWLSDATFESIVFCENSAYDLSILRRVAGDRVRSCPFLGTSIPGIWERVLVASSVRLKDYGRALNRWLSDATFESIVFCENSAYDLSILRRVAGDRVQFLSFSGNEYPRHLGKGFGEMLILGHALSVIPFREDDLIVKVTGRYFVRNAHALVSYMRDQQDCEVFCNLYADGTAESRIFAASARFFKEHLLVLRERVNDTAGVYFEHVLAAAVGGAIQDGVHLASLPETPDIVGISGTHDRNFNPSTIERVRDRSDQSAAPSLVQSRIVTLATHFRTYAALSIATSSRIESAQR